MFKICVGIFELRPQLTFLWEISDESFMATFFYQEGREGAGGMGFSMPKRVFLLLKHV